MNINTLQNDEDYASAMASLLVLMSREIIPGSDDEKALDRLALVIQDFERRTVAPVTVEPLEAILFYMDQMQLTHKDLIPYIGPLAKVSAVLSGKCPLSLPIVRRLSAGLGIPAAILIATPTPTPPALPGRKEPASPIN